MSAAITAETTAVELAAELRALADRVERATSWASLRESLDALTPTLRSTRGRVVRNTRAPKTAPAERPAPAVEAPKAEPKPAPAEAPTRPAETAPTKAPESPKAAPATPVPPTVKTARCPLTLRLLVLAALLTAWTALTGRARRARYRTVINVRQVANMTGTRARRLGRRVQRTWYRAADRVASTLRRSG